MSTHSEVSRLKAVARRRCKRLMAAIGVELAYCDSGAQSELETCAHIAKLVGQARRLMQGECSRAGEGGGFASAG